MKLQKNTILELNIEDITNLGFGVARHDGMVIFVSGAVRGDKILGKIIKLQSSYAVARIEKFISRSNIRTLDRCNISTCRSCAYRDISYCEEIRIKQAFVESTFKKAGLDVKIADTQPSPIVKGYRNKAQYPVSCDKQGNVKIGFYAPKTHNVCEAAGCPNTPEIFSRIVEFLRRKIIENSISVYSEETGAGLVRHIYLRRGETSCEILLTLVLSSRDEKAAALLTEGIFEEFSDIVGVMININPKKTNVILGEEWICHAGRDYIWDTLSGVKLKITAPSFYQINHTVCEMIYKKALELAAPEKTDTLLDLFCGAGSIGLSMARSAGRLVGVEIISDAVECAKFNAKENNIENAFFFAGDAAVTEELLANAEASLGGQLFPDIVILDPPRGGCDEKLIHFIAGRSPKRIVYISCNPATLARDLKLFHSLGYTADTIYPYDMFPGTGHIENVTLLTKTHNMRLSPEPYKLMSSGKKTIELRLLDEKRKGIRIGDKIIFTNSQDPTLRLRARVIALHHFDSFDELYDSLPLSKFGYTEETIKSADSTDMEKYYSREEQEKYGVIGIEIEIY